MICAPGRAKIRAMSCIAFLGYRNRKFFAASQLLAGDARDEREILMRLDAACPIEPFLQCELQSTSGYAIVALFIILYPVFQILGPSRARGSQLFQRAILASAQEQDRDR